MIKKKKKVPKRRTPFFRTEARELPTYSLLISVLSRKAYSRFTVWIYPLFPLFTTFHHQSIFTPSVKRLSKELTCAMGFVRKKPTRHSTPSVFELGNFRYFLPPSPFIIFFSLFFFFSPIAGRAKSSRSPHGEPTEDEQASCSAARAAM